MTRTKKWGVALENPHGLEDEDHGFPMNLTMNSEVSKQNFRSSAMNQPGAPPWWNDVQLRWKVDYAALEKQIEDEQRQYEAAWSMELGTHREGDPRIFWGIYREYLGLYGHRFDFWGFHGSTNPSKWFFSKCENSPCSMGNSPIWQTGFHVPRLFTRGRGM